MKKECTCGKYKECKAKIQSTKGGRLFIETKDHFSCGKIQNQILELDKLLKK